jgi:hypothetical protein
MPLKPVIIIRIHPIDIIIMTYCRCHIVLRRERDLRPALASVSPECNMHIHSYLILRHE